MKKSLLVLVLAIILHSGYSQIPSGYYDSATGSGYTLKTQLYNIIKDHTSVSYTPGVWNAIYKTDVKPNGFVWDVYSDVPGGSPAYDYTLGSDQCGTYSGEGDCYNREHSFPKSWFNDASPMFTDLFHLYPTDGYVNGKRGNYPFGEVGSASWTSTNGSKLGTCNYPGYSGTVFEPIDEYKGDFARTYFYMATRYENIISGWESNDSNGDAVLDGSSDQVYEDWFLNMIIDWHTNDPVSQKEINRNDSIYYNVQGNRNPFIDHPEYVSQIWGGNSLPNISNISNTPENPTEEEDVTISATITDADGSISSATLKWGTASGSFLNSISMTNSGDVYSAIIGAQPGGTDIYYKVEAEDNEAGISQSSEYSFSFSAVVNELPQISEVSNDPVNPLETEDVTIYASILDSDGTISLAEVKWGTTSGNHGSTVTMSYTGSDDVYSGIIPMQTGGTNIFYIVEATDNDSEMSSSDEYSFTFNTTGNNPPEISNIDFTPSNPESNENVNVSATITDSDGMVSSAKIKWGTNTGTYTQEVDMTNTDNEYSGQIPAQPDATHVYFIIYAMDEDGGTEESVQLDYIVENVNVNPEIADINIDPAEPESSDNVRVSAYITDSDGSISSAKIKWGTTTGNYTNEVNMDESEDLYSGEIPALSNGSTIYFIIEAEDNESGITSSSEYNYIVSDPENQAPIISETEMQPQNPTPNDNVVISCLAEDSDGSVDFVLLKWKLSNTNFTEINMNLSGGRYYGQIPKQAIGETILYTILAEDNEGLQASFNGSYIVSQSNGIEEISSSLKIYPNPAIDFIYVKSDKKIETIIIYNIIGETVFKIGNSQNRKEIISLRNIKSGVYIIQVQVESSITTQKVLVK